nr:hypothetical protein [uncultured Desulfosarcina sp.]
MLIDGELEFANIMPFLIGALFFLVIVIVLNKTIKNIFFQSKYLETLRRFAEERRYKKPISKWCFVFIEIVGLFLALLFLVSFFKNAFATVGVIFILLVFFVFLAVKFYTPPFKALALAEKLTYNDDVVCGEYKGRDVYIKMEKESVDISPRSIIEREKSVDFKKRVISVSLSLDNEKIKSIRYQDGKITVYPEILNSDFSYPEGMFSDIPVSDKICVYISQINGNDYLTIEKVNRNILFTAELYYLCEIAERMLASIDNAIDR